MDEQQAENPTPPIQFTLNSVSVMVEQNAESPDTTPISSEE